MIKVIRDVKGRKLDKNVSKARQVQKPNSYPENALDIKLSKRLIEFFNMKKGQEIEIEPINKNRFEVDIL